VNRAADALVVPKIFWRKRMKKYLKSKNLIFIFLILPISFILILCEKNPQGPDNDIKPILSGTVKDSDGFNLENVGIHLILFNSPWLSKNNMKKENVISYSIKIPVDIPTNYSLYQNYPNPFNPSTTISYQLPNQSDLRITVYNYPENDTVATLVYSTYAAGLYRVSWDGRNDKAELVTDGLYSYKMEANDFKDEKIMCVNMLEPAILEQSKAKTHTNAKGVFQIEYKNIPIGAEINHTDETGPEILGQWTVPDSITIVLTKTGYESIQKKIVIDSTQNVEYDFVMNRK
jgi:hypothetical protein